MSCSRSRALLGEPVLPRWRRRRIHAAVGDELRHALFEDRQRHRAERENRVVEAPLVELRAELLFRLAAVPADLQLTELVREGLAGPRDVALDLGRDLVLRERGARPQ